MHCLKKKKSKMSVDSTKNPEENQPKETNVTNKNHTNETENINKNKAVVIETLLPASIVKALSQTVCNQEKSSGTSEKQSSNLTTLEIHIQMGQLNKVGCQKPNRKNQSPAKSCEQRFEQEFNQISCKLKHDLDCGNRLPPMSCCPCSSSAGKEYLEDKCPQVQSQSPCRPMNKQKTCQKTETTLFLNAQQLSNLTNLLSGNRTETHVSPDSKNSEATFMVDANTLSELVKLISKQQSH